MKYRKMQSAEIVIGTTGADQLAVNDGFWTFEPWITFNVCGAPEATNEFEDSQKMFEIYWITNSTRKKM